MNEAVYSWIDFSLLGISIAQFIISLIGIIGIVYTVLAYKKTVEAQESAQQQTNLNIKILTDILNNDIKKHRLALRPYFQIKYANSSVHNLMFNARLTITNLKAKANNVLIELDSDDNWDLDNNYGNRLENFNFGLINSDENKDIYLKYKEKLPNSNKHTFENLNVKLRVRFYDDEGVGYIQRFQGSITKIDIVSIDLLL